MKLRLKWFFTLLIALSVQLSFAQDLTVTGKVLEGGFPLPGVSIFVQGTTNGVQTDMDGNYSIKAKKGQTLVYSFIGMQSVYQVVGNSSTINVTMYAEDSQLEEVVVMAFGQVKNKNEVTGSAVKVTGDVIASVPLVSPDQALQGRVAGLQMATTSGTPGSTQQIRIRGIASMGGASNEPLFVIDGVPIVNGNLGQDGSSTLSPLSSINANDIESMTVLKDAASTAPYGARGAAGVIIITTKKGKFGGTKYSLSTTAGIQNKAVKGLPMASGAQKEELFLEAVYNDFGSRYGFSKDQAYSFLTANPTRFTTAVQNHTRNLTAWKNNGSQEYNWDGLLTRKDALYYNLDFNATGGDDKSTFFASLGYNKTESIAFGGEFRRVSGSLAYDRKLSDKVKFLSNIRFTNTLQDAILENGSYFSNPLLTQYFMSPWYSPYTANGDYNLNLGGLHNTLYTIKNNISKTYVSRFMGNFGVDYQITKGLKFNSTMGLDFILNDYENYRNPIHGDGASVGGSASNYNRRTFNYVSQNSLSYSFGIYKHKFNASAIMEYQKNKNTGLYGYGNTLPTGFNQLINAAANWNASNEYSDWAQLSYTGLVNYNYDGKYLVDASFRREGSSRFNPDGRWGNFWSVGAGWNIMNEDFMESLEAINLLRLRGSYGTTGNNGINANLYQALLGTGNYGTEVSYTLSQLPAVITWEKQNKIDVGLDYGFLNSRITGAVAWYRSTSKDLLFADNPLTRTSGHSSQPINAGSMRNQGWEFELDVLVVDTEPFKFNVSANFATVDNKVIKMPFDSETGAPKRIINSTRITEEGQPLNAWYMRKYAGVDPQTGQALYYINGEDGATTTTYGQAKQALQGKSALPKYTGGLTLHFESYNFFLDALFYYSAGNKVYQDWGSFTNSTGSSALTYNYSTEVLDRWQQPGDITNTPKVITTASTSEQVSTRFLYDGDFVRLRDVTFGYKFPAEMLKNTMIDGVTLSVKGTNLWTWVKDDNLKYDPEVRADGFTNLANPPIKQVSFSANIKF